MGVHVTPDTLLFELLRAKNNTNAAYRTFKPIVQYYCVILCEFESERKWIVGAVPTNKNWQKIEAFLTQVLLIRRTLSFGIFTIVCMDRYVNR